MAPAAATVMKRSLRVTFSDQVRKKTCFPIGFFYKKFAHFKVGNVGGVMGLFLGMSILSVFEVAMWLAKTAFSLIKWRGSRGSKSVGSPPEVKIA